MKNIKEKIASIMSDMDFALYDVIEANEDGKPVVRVLIDSESYITIDDCVFVSRKLGDALDADDLYEGRIPFRSR